CAEWATAHVVSLLKAGVSPRGSVMGPMAEVVYRSTQYLSDDDLRAMAVFLKALPQVSPESDGESWLSWFSGRKRGPPAEDLRARGAKIYEQSCAQCHGDEGEGALGAYPALAGNRAVTMDVTANLIRGVLNSVYLTA